MGGWSLRSLRCFLAHRDSPGPSITMPKKRGGTSGVLLVLPATPTSPFFHTCALVFFWGLSPFQDQFLSLVDGSLCLPAKFSGLEIWVWSIGPLLTFLQGFCQGWGVVRIVLGLMNWSSAYFPDYKGSFRDGSVVGQPWVWSVGLLLTILTGVVLQRMGVWSGLPWVWSVRTLLALLTAFVLSGMEVWLGLSCSFDTVLGRKCENH